MGRSRAANSEQLLSEQAAVLAQGTKTMQRTLARLNAVHSDIMVQAEEVRVAIMTQNENARVAIMKQGESIERLAAQSAALLEEDYRSATRMIQALASTLGRMEQRFDEIEQRISQLTPGS